MMAHGFMSYNMSGLSYTDQMGLVGRGMSAAALAIVLGAAAKALGALRPL